MRLEANQLERHAKSIMPLPLPCSGLLLALWIAYEYSFKLHNSVRVPQRQTTTCLRRLQEGPHVSLRDSYLQRATYMMGRPIAVGWMSGLVGMD
jgi:hypothetical protein